MTDNEFGPDEHTERGVLPLVAHRQQSAPTWVLLIAAGFCAVLLFVLLDRQRRGMRAPPVQAQMAELPAFPAAVPTLTIPPESSIALPSASVALRAPESAQPSLPFGSPFSSTAVIPRQALLLPPSPQNTAPMSQTEFRAPDLSGSTVVIDNSTQGAGGAAQPTPNGIGGQGIGSVTTARVRAGMLPGKSTTVIQGSLIHAVLETGFDSTRPGYARAMVSRDVRGFDGTRILIPRGSRLVGEYQADIRAGEHRALIMWTRLVRPDGATIEIASPATDPVGRGGIKADVNSHFFERFSGAILQSVLNLGVNLAARSADRAIIVALPGSGSAGPTNPIVQPTNIAPTLKVKPAVSISVFLARDLDFSEVEPKP